MALPPVPSHLAMELSTDVLGVPDNSPAGPWLPVAPVAPVSPRGIEKLNVAALEDPALVTVAEDPADPVVTDPTAMVAAVPDAPVLPVAPVSPF